MRVCLIEKAFALSIWPYALSYRQLQNWLKIKSFPTPFLALSLNFSSSPQISVLIAMNSERFLLTREYAIKDTVGHMVDTSLSPAVLGWSGLAGGGGRVNSGKLGWCLTYLDAGIALCCTSICEWVLIDGGTAWKSVAGHFYVFRYCQHLIVLTTCSCAQSELRRELQFQNS